MESEPRFLKLADGLLFGGDLPFDEADEREGKDEENPRPAAARVVGGRLGFAGESHAWLEACCAGCGIVISESLEVSMQGKVEG